MRNVRRRRAAAPLRAWAGDSLWRQFVAWLVRSAALLALAAIVFAIVWSVLLPGLIEGLSDQLNAQNR